MAPGIIEVSSSVEQLPQTKSLDQDSLPKIGEYALADANVEGVVESLVRSGACIIRGLLNAGQLAEIEKETRPFLGVPQEWQGHFFPTETRKSFSLAAKSPAYIQHISSNQLYLDVADKVLGTTSSSWNGEEYETCTSKPQFSTAAVFSIAPGAKAQGLHRDDMVHHNNLEAITVDQYKFGRDMDMGLFVAGKKTTKANGATRLVPGSHLMDSVTKPDDSNSIYVELNPGDAFFMLCSAYHGGSANTTKDEERLMYASLMTRGYLRQNENQYLALSLEQAKALDERTLRLLGFGISPPFLGWVDGNDPMDTIFQKAKKSTGDLF